MDIYQIIITHNRSWTIREIIAFAVVFLMAVFLAAVLLRLHKIVIIQAVCGLLLLTFFLCFCYTFSQEREVHF